MSSSPLPLPDSHWRPSEPLKRTSRRNLTPPLQLNRVSSQHHDRTAKAAVDSHSGGRLGCAHHHPRSFSPCFRCGRAAGGHGAVLEAAKHDTISALLLHLFYFFIFLPPGVAMTTGTMLMVCAVRGRGCKWEGSYRVTLALPNLVYSR